MLQNLEQERERATRGTKGTRILCFLCFLWLDPLTFEGFATPSCKAFQGGESIFAIIRCELLPEQRAIVAIILADEFVDPLQFRTERKGPSNRPRLFKNIWIFDCCFVLQSVEIGSAKPFDHMQAFGMTKALEFRLLVEADRVHDQRVSLPVAHRVAQPAWIRVDRVRAPVRRYDAKRSRVFVKYRHVTRVLQNLKLIRHTPGLRWYQRHAVRCRPGIFRSAHDSEFLSSGLQNRSRRRSPRRTAGTAASTEIIDSGKIRLAVQSAYRRFARGIGGHNSRHSSRDIDGNRSRENLIVWAAYRERVRGCRRRRQLAAAACIHAPQVRLDRHTRRIFRIPHEREGLAGTKRCGFGRKADDPGGQVPGLPVRRSVKARGNRSGRSRSLRGLGLRRSLGQSDGPDEHRKNEGTQE